MKHAKLVASALAVTAVAALTAVAPAGADTGKNPARGGRYCAIEVDKAPEGEFSPIRSQTCSDDPNAAALTRIAASETLLMEWFWNAWNDPPYLTRVYGSYGGCDRSGYKIRPNVHWYNEISGFDSWNGCNVVTAYDHYNFTGDQQTWARGYVCECIPSRDTGWIGPYMNDRIESFWIRHS